MNDAEVLNSAPVRVQIDRATSLVDHLRELGDLGELTVAMMLDGLGSADLVLAPDPGLVVEGGIVSHGLVGMLAV